MTAAQVAFLAAFTLLLILLAAATVGIVIAAVRPAGLTRRRGLLRALGLSPALPAAPTRWAHYLHALTGIGIFAFLALHIADVSLLAFSASGYNWVLQFYGTPVLRLLECALVLAVLFHSLNGLRLILTDIAWPADQTGRWVVAGATADRPGFYAVGDTVFFGVPTGQPRDDGRRERR